MSSEDDQNDSRIGGRSDILRRADFKRSLASFESVRTVSPAADHIIAHINELDPTVALLYLPAMERILAGISPIEIFHGQPSTFSMDGGPMPIFLSTSGAYHGLVDRSLRVYPRINVDEEEQISSRAVEVSYNHFKGRFYPVFHNVIRRDPVFGTLRTIARLSRGRVPGLTSTKNNLPQYGIEVHTSSVPVQYLRSVDFIVWDPHLAMKPTKFREYKTS